MDLLVAFPIAVVVVLLGFLLCYVTSVRPLRSNLSQVHRELALSARQEREHTAEIAELSRQITTLESAIAQLEPAAAGATKPGSLIAELDRVKDDLAAVAAQAEHDPEAADAQAAVYGMPVTAVRIVISWRTRGEDTPGWGRKTAQEGGEPEGTGPGEDGRLVAEVEARSLSPSEMRSLSPVLDRYAEYLTSGYNAEGFRQAVRDAVSERLADPIYEPLSGVLPVSDFTGLALAARDLEGASSFIITMAETPLEAAERAIGIGDLGVMGAAVGANFILGSAIRPISQAAVVCEVAGFAIGAVTGAYPLMAACGKLLLRRQIRGAVEEGITGLLRGGDASRDTSASRDGREPREARTGPDAERHTREPDRRAGEGRPGIVDRPERGTTREPWQGPASRRPGGGRPTGRSDHRGEDDGSRDEPDARWDRGSGRFSGPSRGGR